MRRLPWPLPGRFPGWGWRRRKQWRPDSWSPPSRGVNMPGADTPMNTSAPLMHIRQSLPVLFLEVGDLRHLLLDPGFSPAASGINRSGPVAHDDVSEAQRKAAALRWRRPAAPAPEVTTCTSSVLLADHLQGVEQTCQRDHGGPMLIIVEDRDVAALLQAGARFRKQRGAEISSRFTPPKLPDMQLARSRTILVHLLGSHAQGDRRPHLRRL